MAICSLNPPGNLAIVSRKIESNTHLGFAVVDAEDRAHHLASARKISRRCAHGAVKLRYYNEIYITTSIGSRWVLEGFHASLIPAPRGTSRSFPMKCADLPRRLFQVLPCHIANRAGVPDLRRCSASTRLAA